MDTDQRQTILTDAANQKTKQTFVFSQSCVLFMIFLIDFQLTQTYLVCWWYDKSDKNVPRENAGVFDVSAS